MEIDSGHELVCRPGQIVFARVARRLIEDGHAEAIMPAHTVLAADRYNELLVMQLAAEFAKHGETWFRERYKEFIL